MKLLAIAAAACAAIASAAHADTINIVSGPGLENKGAFTGSVNYNAAQSKVTFTLLNTSPVANEGFITAFVFNTVGNITATLSSAKRNGSNVNWNGLSNVSGNPFGTFEFGATGGNGGSGNFGDGGNPATNGIGVGQTGVFVFNLTGNLTGVSAASFLSQPANGGSQGDNVFVVRYRGFCDGSSDKVPLAGGSNNGDPVPLPAAALGGAALLGLLGASRLRRQKPTA